MWLLMDTIMMLHSFLQLSDVLFAWWGVGWGGA